MRIRSIARPTAPAAAVLLAALSLTACGGDEQAATDDPVDVETSQEADTGASGEPLDFEDVSDDLESRVGDELTLRATVESVVTPEVFTLTDPADTTLDPIVVVNANAAEDIESGTDVVVTGTVEEEFEMSEIEDTLKIQLDDEILGDLEGNPFIEATKVSTQPSGA